MSPLGQIYDPHGSWWGTVHPGLASVGMDGLQQKLSIWVKITICRLHKGTFTMWLEPAVSLQRLFSKDTVVQPPCQSTNQNEGNQETEIWKHPALQRKRNSWKDVGTAFSLGGKKAYTRPEYWSPRKERTKIVFCFLPILIPSDSQSESSGGKIYYLLNRISLLCQVVNCFK